jgi:ribosomal protein L21E
MNEVIKQHLLRHQARMKSQADKNRTEVHFKVGDKVFLKIQTYVSLLCPP